MGWKKIAETEKCAESQAERESYGDGSFDIEGFVHNEFLR
jgi:hypothetical protein